MIWAGPQSLPRSPGIGWGHGGVQQPQPYFPQPQPRFNPYASQNPKFMPLPGPMPGPMPPPRGPGKGRSGRSYRPPTFPSNYGQMRYTPQRFGGYGIPSSLPGILNPPIGPPPGGPGKGRRPGGPGRKGGGSPGKGGGGSPGQFPPSGPPPTQLPSPPPSAPPSGPGRKGGGGPVMTGQPVQFQDIRPVMQPQPIAVNQPYLPQRMRVNQQNQTNQFQPQPGSGFGMPPPPAPLAMGGDPVDVGFSSGVTVPQPTMSQAQKRAQYFQKQRMKRAGYSTGGITDLPVDRRQEGGKTGDSGSKTRMSELMDQGFSYDEALNAAILEKQGARPVASGESASSYEQSQADRQRRFNEIQTLARQEMLRRINQVEGHVPGPQRGFLKTTLMNEIQQDYDKYPRGEYVFRRDRTE